MFQINGKDSLSSQVIKYISYKINAVSKHKVHSPFVFDLIVDVFEDDNSYYAFPAVELIRKKLLLTKRTLTVEDMGAGSRVFKSNERKIKDIVKHSAQKPKYSQLLFKLVNYYQSKTILELGTSLGLTTAYLAKARKKAKIHTLEGSPEICKAAKNTFKSLLVKNVQLVQGNFNDILPEALSQIVVLDFAFFDGNHEKKPTLDYFNQCLEKANEHSVFVFDDIHWSDEMTEAWEEIKNHPKVTLTVDIFQFGIVFFRTGIEKQHFVLRY
ncbi:class I SAM-dependent methyltransferase [Flavobacteriales bacterium]|nr:class I SAM-dependent methyltransferase [Flavobacteriales bacterium]